MPREAKQTAFIDELTISKENYDRLLMWGMSLKEINFICFGKGKHIEEVVRLSNTARRPKQFASWHEKVSEDIIKAKQLEGKKVIASGHSHPNKWDDQHPSEMDIAVIPKGQIELIVFPIEQKIGAWQIRRNTEQTLGSKINLKLI